MQKISERLVPLNMEGKCYFIYFTGKTYFDNDKNGKLVEKEVSYYLDENLNKFVLNYNKDFIEQFADEFSKKVEKLGKKVFIGPHSPEKEDVDGTFIMNNDKNTLGIWEKPSKEELLHYNYILDKQNKERNAIRLSY